MKEKKEFAEERRTKILHFLEQNKKADVTELSGILGVTEATIRRDLIFLENKDCLYRTHGGAIYREKQVIWQTTSLSDRQVQNHEEKLRIALYVASLVSDGESLMIDGGSTTLLLAHELAKKRNLLVITNTSTIGDEIIKSDNGNKVFLAGGELIYGTFATLGPLTESTIRSFRVNKAIIGLSALHPSQGCFSAIPQEGVIKRLMMEYAQEKIIITDSSKIGKIALSFVCDLNNIDKLITDSNIEAKDLEKIRQQGVEVFVV